MGLSKETNVERAIVFDRYVELYPMGHPDIQP